MLSRQLEGWLEEARKGAEGSKAAQQHPQRRLKALIGPHAGYRYSGHVAAHAYAHIDPSTVTRVVLLGPSHRHYTRKCLVTSAQAYSTPLGDIAIDTDLCRTLVDQHGMDYMDLDVDEAEHSLEMHLPFIFKVLESRIDQCKLIPIMVGAVTPVMEKEYGRVLAPLFSDPATIFIASSDFCHWGSRFEYQPHTNDGTKLYQQIQRLDHEGMESISTMDPDHFRTYLARTKNTICGRHPICILLHAVEACHEPQRTGGGGAIEWVKYDQSSQVLSMADSSVSYASGLCFI